MSNAATAAVHAADDEIVAALNQFVDERIIPVSNELEPAGTYPQVLVDELKQLGAFGIPIKEEYGGLGGNLFLTAEVFEALGRGWIAVGDIFSTHFTAVRLIQEYGTDAQKDEFLPSLAAGDLIGGIALTEPHAGSDLRSVRSTATETHNGYVLKVSKTMITHIQHADPILTLVRMRRKDGSDDGYGVFIIRQGEEGVTTTGSLGKLGHVGCELGEVFCDQLEVPADRLLGGTSGLGLRQMLGGMDYGRVYIAAGALGQAQRAFDLALKYTGERVAFGSKLAEMPVVKTRLADMYMEIAKSRSLIKEACRLILAGGQREVGSRAAAVAKICASDAGVFCAKTSMQLHGGYGFTKEFEIERIYRDAVLATIAEGTNDILRDVIAKISLKLSNA